MENNIQRLVQQLADKKEEIYSKVGIFIEQNKDYKHLCKVRLIDSSNTESSGAEIVDLYDVRLSAEEGGSYTVPKKNSPVIVTFLNRNEAYVSLISNADFTVIQVTNEFGEPVSMEIRVDNGVAAVNFNNVNSFKINTKTNASVTIDKVSTDNTFIIREFDFIKLAVKDGNSFVIDKDGINVNLSDSSKFFLGNSVVNLKDILLKLVDTLLTVPLFTSPTVTLLPTIVTELNAIKTSINNLFK